MTSSAQGMPTVSLRAVTLRFENDLLYVRLEDGREIGTPLTWFPRLVTATDVQRNNWLLMGRGIGIHWPDVDEDILVEGLLRAN